MSLPEIITQTARKLRKNMTPAEVFLWSKLKDESLGLKVLRQKPIHIYTEDSGLERYIIADFYIPEKKVVIEIDGEIHSNVEIYNLDREKEKFLAKKGIQVMRFTNDQVFNNSNFILRQISSLHGREVPEGGWDVEGVQKFLEKSSDKPKIIIIFGPTASGKTDMSIEIAKYLDTEIISTDSRQIFKYMDIGTGKITPDEMQGVPHHMLDIITPNEVFSVGDFKLQAEEIISKLQAEDKIPMLVGGTGLYIESLIYDFSLPKVPADETIRKELSELSNEGLYEKLQEIDPEYARELHPNNRHYVERAIEVKMLTGKSKTEFREDKEPKHDILLLYPQMPGEYDIFSMEYRQWLYNRINMRVEKMFENGAEQELKNLIDMGYGEDDFGMNAIGYREFFPYFKGEISKTELIEHIQQHSRNYAKRQITWFRKYEKYL